MLLAMVRNILIVCTDSAFHSEHKRGIGQFSWELSNHKLPLIRPLPLLRTLSVKYLETCQG